jgi:6-pyruvoyltetrahydropterin/6-carboxytetrahydropterin synthase
VFTITRLFEFNASHLLTGLRPDHKCGRLHGHNYAVELSLEAGELDEGGFVVEFGDLDPFGAFLDATLDHRHLNEVLPFQPSSEMLARYLFEWCVTHLPEPVGARLRAVRVSENPWSTSASYTPASPVRAES